MKRKHVVVVGSSFAGFAGAIELKKRLGAEHDVTVVSRSDQFLFTPSLIWVPFGRRTRSDITFDVRPPLEQNGIRFLQAEVLSFSLENRSIRTGSGDQSYDYLLIATGPKTNYAAIPGLGPRGYTHSIMTLPEAERAGAAFERLLRKPGPVVIGSVQNASGFVAAYDFLFIMAHELMKAGLTDEAPLTLLTNEPFAGHFGIDGQTTNLRMNDSLRKLGIQALANATVEKITPKAICLTSGAKVPFSYAMLIPSFLGVDPVRACSSITDVFGFVRVNEYYQTFSHPEVFSAGLAATVCAPRGPSIPGSVPRTGYLSEQMAKTAARNIAALIHDERLLSLEDRLLNSKEHEWLAPGPDAHWAKLGIESYFMSSRKRGYV